MFTGIISDVGRIASVSKLDQGTRFRIDTDYDPASIDIGASIACSGVCLTVTALPAEGDNATMADLNLREGLVLAPLLALIVFMGVYPKPVIERMEPAVDALVAHVEHHVDGFHEPTSQFGSEIAPGDGHDEHVDAHGDDH